MAAPLLTRTRSILFFDHKNTCHGMFDLSIVGQDLSVPHKGRLAELRRKRQSDIERTVTVIAGYWLLLQ